MAWGAVFWSDPLADGRRLVVGLIVDESQREREEADLVPATVVFLRRRQCAERLNQATALIVGQLVQPSAGGFLKVDRHERVDLFVHAGVQPPHQVDKQARGSRQRGEPVVLINSVVIGQPGKTSPDGGHGRRIYLVGRVVVEPGEQVIHVTVRQTREFGIIDGPARHDTRTA